MSKQQALQTFSEQSIVNGSKSFSFAGFLLTENVRADAFSLYAWCRYCDDVIDDAPNKKNALQQLQHLQTLTEKALTSDTGELPLPFQALASVVQKYNIPRDYPLELLKGMEMDVNGYEYITTEDLDLYCYRVAGVVGLMMAHIMGISHPQALTSACSLGKAMQLTNISRDIVEDYKINRVYLPQEWLDLAGIPRHNILDKVHREKLVQVVDRLLAWADSYYVQGNKGIGFLNWRCAFAIQAASNIYREIGNIVRKREGKAWDTRAYTSKTKKMVLAVKSLFQIVHKTAWQIFKPWVANKNLKVIEHR